MNNASKEKTTEKVVENVDQKLARLLESNVRLGETTHACNYTDEQLKIREAILAQYGHVSYIHILFSFQLLKLNFHKNVYCS